MTPPHLLTRLFAIVVRLGAQTLALCATFNPAFAHAQDGTCGLQGTLATSCARTRATFAAAVQATAQGSPDGAALALEGCRRVVEMITSLEVAAGSSPSALSSINSTNDAIGAGIAVAWSPPDDLRRARRFCAALTSETCAPLDHQDRAALVEGAAGTVALGQVLAVTRRALGRCQPTPAAPPAPERTHVSLFAELGALVPLGDDLSRRGHDALVELAVGPSFGRARWLIAPQLRLRVGPGSVAGTTHPLAATYFGGSLGVAAMYPVVHHDRLDVGLGGEAFVGFLGRSVDAEQMAWAYAATGLLSVFDIGVVALVRWRPYPAARWWIRAVANADLHALSPVDDGLLVGATAALRIGVDADL